MKETTVERDGQHDFDFLAGTWHIQNRRLRERLVGCQDWEEFEGESAARLILGGAGNMDEVTMYREAGPMLGYTLRLYNPDSQEWAIYWASPGNIALVPPMVGKFVDNRGEFYAHETHAGKHIYSRFVWTVISPISARWEQAFSADGGRTWETNWTMDLTKQD
jgi:hypothetical protein